MQEPLQLPVAGRVMRGVYGFVVLAEKLGLFLLGEVTKNHFRVVRILNLSRLGGHATQVTPGPGRWRAHAGLPEWPMTTLTGHLRLGFMILVNF